jgi:hypothetical protein
MILEIYRSEEAAMTAVWRDETLVFCLYMLENRKTMLGWVWASLFAEADLLRGSPVTMVFIF